jgi:Ca2+-binding RTX toxin-like protein
VMDVDGSDQTRLTDSPDIDDSPEYSPDGQSIVFRSRRNDGQSDLFTMNADGSGQEALVSTPDRSELRAVYSPDGTQIAFAASPLDTPELEFDVFTAAADGGGIVNVTNTPDVNERHVDWQRIPDAVARTCAEPYPNLRGGTDAGEELVGGDDADAIRARGGDDTVSGRKLSDCLYGGGGNDVLRGKGGEDQLRGGGGDDELRGGAGGDRLLGGRGDDVLRGGGGADTVNCGAGEDRVVLSAGSDDEVRANCEEVVRT